MTGWSGRRVLVTGAGGFIGSHLAERLVREGARVRAFVHYNALGKRGWLDESSEAAAMEVVAGDVADRDTLAAACEDVEIVFHLAALIAIPYSYHAPASYVRVNVEGTLNALQAARQAGVGRFVHTSTSEVYGTANYVPIDEVHPLQAQSPYAASKIGADQMALAFHRAFGLSVAVVRPFNTYGPRQSARAVIPTIIGQCLRGGAVRLGNLHPTRDLCFVDDTVSGFILAADAPGAVGRAVNLGTGREISIGDLAELIARLAGVELVLEDDTVRRRPAGSEVERLLSVIGLARELLGYAPRVSLEDGLGRTIEWTRARLREVRSDYVL